MGKDAFKPGAPDCQKRPLSGLRIIVADDDRRMREFYEAVLAAMRHDVIASAADGRDLVAACLEHAAADLVVTDIRMPAVDGLAAAQTISKHRELPFVFVSAYHDETLIQAASLEYSYGYLVKPIKREDLAASIPVAMRRFWERR